MYKSPRQNNDDFEDFLNTSLNKVHSIIYGNTW